MNFRDSLIENSKLWNNIFFLQIYDSIAYCIQDILCLWENETFSTSLDFSASCSNDKNETATVQWRCRCRKLYSTYKSFSLSLSFSSSFLFSLSSLLL